MLDSNFNYQRLGWAWPKWGAHSGMAAWVQPKMEIWMFDWTKPNGFYTHIKQLKTVN